MSMKRMGLRCAQWVTLMVCLCLAGSGWAQEDPSAMRLRDQFSDQVQDSRLADGIAQYPFYADYRTAWDDAGAKPYTGEPVPLNLESEALTELDGRMAYCWEATGSERLVYTVDVPEDGVYWLTYDYYPWKCNNQDARRSFSWDGRTLFREGTTMAFTWVWREADKPARNQLGDDVRPAQEIVPCWQTATLRDLSGYYREPYGFCLTAGTHELILDNLTGNVALANLRLTAPVSIPTYAEYADRLPENAMQGETILFQAEDEVVGKSAASIQRIVSDDPATTPYEYGYQRLNAFGGYYFSEGNQWTTWRFQVDKEGLYQLGMRVSKDNNGLPVYRSIALDGQVLFREMEEYAFHADGAYALEVLRDGDGQPYLFHLTAGEHTLTIRVVLEENYALIRRIMAVDDTLSDVILQLTMLTGPNADANYDYDILKAMPLLPETLAQVRMELEGIADDLSARTQGITAAESGFRQYAARMALVEKHVDFLQRYADELTGIQSGLATWQTVLENQPLEIDWFCLASPEAEMQTATATILQRMKGMAYNFALSFVKDYDSVGGVEEVQSNQVIDVWAAMGMENAEIVKQLCDERFTPQSGISINLNVMPAGQLDTGSVNALMLSVISGQAPDVALGAGKGAAVEFAIRGAVEDLSKMPGYDELAADFLPETLHPDSFMGGQYGIPERLDFRVMFYRKDILSALGISLPDTWQDVYDYTLPMLYQNNLQIYIPQEAQGFSMFLYQHGGEYYTPDSLGCALNTPEAFDAFDELISLYTKYSIPYTTNFYNRFRIGDMPIGIGGVGEYMALNYGAANLTGKWGIALIPGTVQADGSISRAYTGTVQSSAILLSSSEKKEAGWEFLRWWMSAETQQAYMQEVEIRIGGGSRIASANIRAFETLPLPREDMAVALASLRSVREPEGVLGGYYTERHIKNAWNRMIVDELDMNARDSFELAIESIEKEMAAKQGEYPALLERSGEACTNPSEK